MKKAALLTATLLFLVLTTKSCSSDDDNNNIPGLNPQENQLVGKWEIEKMGMIVDGEEILDDYESPYEHCGKDYILMRADKTGQQSEYGEDEEGACEENSTAFEWSVEGTLLSVSNSEGANIVDILLLNSNALKIGFTEDFGDGEVYVILLFAKV